MNLYGQYKYKTCTIYKIIYDAFDVKLHNLLCFGSPSEHLYTIIGSSLFISLNKNNLVTDR